MVALLLLLLVGPIVVSNVDVIVIEVYKAIILSCVFNNKTLYNVFYCFSKYSTR